MKITKYFKISNWIILYLISYTIPGNCQFNLVPNPSFEAYDTCPNIMGKLRYADYWEVYAVQNSSPDYFNSCSTVLAGVPNNKFGYEQAHSGNAYAGFATYSFNGTISTNFREYLQVQLIDTLQLGKDYLIRFFVSAADSMLYVCNDLGVFLSPTPITHNCSPAFYCNLPLQPQFENTQNITNRIGWTEINFTYSAIGGESHIIIGNFKDTTSTTAIYTGWGTNLSLGNAYFYLDDILVTPLDSITGIYFNNQYNEIFINQQGAILNINFNNPKNNSIYLYDLNGKLVFYENNIFRSDYELNLGFLHSGLYFLRLNNSKSKSFKFFNP